MEYSPLIYWISGLVSLIALVGIVVLWRSRNSMSRLREQLAHEVKYLSFKIQDLNEAIATQHDTVEKTRQRQLSGELMASRIQSAAFTQQSGLSAIFPDSFIFTKPRSLVSGDFFKAVDMEHYSFLALADCSGYGIPGGFLSMLGVAIISEQISRHFSDADINLSEMLQNMRDDVIRALRSRSSDIVNDGMNMTLVAIHKHSPKLYFAGAGQNLYISHGSGIQVVQGDKYPVGWYIKGNLSFRQHCLPVEPGDMVYLSTNSLQNQFGGPNGLKFTHKRIVQMMSAICRKPCPVQREIIHDTVFDWVDGHKQVDDLSLVGVRILEA